MPESKKKGSAIASPENARARIRRAVGNLLTGSGLHVQELANELVITNPRAPEKGQVHVDLTDGYVSWEYVTWNYWGTLAGLPETGEYVISGNTILDALLGRPASGLTSGRNTKP